MFTCIHLLFKIYILMMLIKFLIILSSIYFSSFKYCDFLNSFLLSNIPLNFFFLFFLLNVTFVWILIFFNSSNLILLMLILEVTPVLLCQILYMTSNISIESNIIFFFLLLILAGESALGLALLIQKHKHL